MSDPAAPDPAELEELRQRCHDQGRTIGTLQTQLLEARSQLRPLEARIVLLESVLRGAIRSRDAWARKALGRVGPGGRLGADSGHSLD